ncbi:MAG: hypothetical protein PVF83_06900 [Anaerolineales bacterium]|jgi:hypothetical protein
MDYTKVLKQAWKNVVNYRALWIFGIILALTTASTTNTAVSQSSKQRTESREGIMGTGVSIQPLEGESIWDAAQRAFRETGEVLGQEFEQADEEMTHFYQEDLGLDITSNVIKLITTLIWVFIVFLIFGTFLRYISETALISMVDDREESGEQLRVRDGFRLGWSRTSWRLFLIDVIIFVPVALVFILLFAIIFAPLLLLAFGIKEVSIFSGVLTAGLFFIFVFLAIIADQLIRVLKQFARRECVVNKQTPIDAIRNGFNLAKSNIKDVGIIWLVLVGVNVGWPIVMALCTILIVALDIVISGILGLLVGLTASLAGAAEPVVTGFLVGVPLFLLLLGIPMAILAGLKEVFTSSTWTLTYRELLALSGMKAEALPEPEEA